MRLHDAADRSQDALRRAGHAVLLALVVAQALFVAYLFASYGRATLAGDLAAWATFSAKGWVPGDAMGNGAMAAHLAFAVVVLLAGAVQLAPAVRRRAPAVHRWSGRLYLTGCLLGAVSGLALVWGRGTVGDLSQHVAITINALLLVGCAAMAWRTARARAFDAHRGWAIRTFAVANGVLFFRLLLATWLLAWRAPVGFDEETFSGPFLTALAFTVYVVGPLAVHEAYLRARRSRSRGWRTATAGLLGAIALVLLGGTGAAALVLWIPRL